MHNSWYPAMRHGALGAAMRGLNVVARDKMPSALVLTSMVAVPAHVCPNRAAAST
jgi:hypothetical protein